jgi:hypothetical protein
MNEPGGWIGVVRGGAGVLVALVLGLVYVATGGRAWFGTRERPERREQTAR